VAATRPASFSMPIQGGMLEALGINMYTTLGKCLVEFVANAYDSNASEVDISIPFDRIEAAREEIKVARAKEREQLKADGSDNGKDEPDLSSFTRTIDESIEISVSDNGHGMSPQDVADKFLPVNRRRRLDSSGKETSIRSEGNRRHVMGRKGLGKLAGFGTAQTIEVRTKRKDETFRTCFVMDAAQLLAAPNLAEMPIPATYEDAVAAEVQGTTILMRRLKPDAVKSTREKIEATLAEAFYGIDPKDFLIRLNGEPIKGPDIQYEFEYPVGLPADTLSSEDLEIPDVGPLHLEWVVRFRSRGQHLTARQRGARIYCNHRLAAGPSLFRLTTGMHNFHGQDYMECIVVADQLDRLGIDFVNTNRTQLREDNDVVDRILTRVTDIMREALAAHSVFRDKVAEREIQENVQGRVMAGIINQMPARTRTPAGKLLKAFAARFGTKSTEFEELAPLVIQSVNAGEVLIRLIELQADPKTISHVASELRDLAEIQKSDALKLYRGRINGINALRTLIERGEELWKKKQIEGELHQLLKDSPWLVDPEFHNHVTSDQNLTIVSSKVAQVLKVDKFAAISDVEGGTDLTRPDLVFVMADAPQRPHHFVIVELKSPALPLDLEHLHQLQEYMHKVRKFISGELHVDARVTGVLIGAMPGIDDKLTMKQEMLKEEIRKRGPDTQWEVVGLEELLQRTLAVHAEIVHQLAGELKEADSAFAPVVIPEGEVVAPASGPAEMTAE